MDFEYIFGILQNSLTIGHNNKCIIIFIYIEAILDLLTVNI